MYVPAGPRSPSGLSGFLGSVLGNYPSDVTRNAAAAGVSPEQYLVQIGQAGRYDNPWWDGRSFRVPPDVETTYNQWGDPDPRGTFASTDEISDYGASTYVYSQAFSDTGGVNQRTLQHEYVIDPETQADFERQVMEGGAAVPDASGLRHLRSFETFLSRDVNPEFNPWGEAGVVVTAPRDIAPPETLEFIEQGSDVPILIDASETYEEVPLPEFETYGSAGGGGRSPSDGGGGFLPTGYDASGAPVGAGAGLDLGKLLLGGAAIYFGLQLFGGRRRGR